MDDTQHRLDEIRRSQSEAGKHLIDEYAAARISRRDFVRRGTVVGMSLSLLSFLAAVYGSGDGGRDDGGA